MALLDIRQRTGYLFLAVTMAHVILISMQVTTQRGIPLFEEVVFGGFAEVQRVTMGVFGFARGSYSGYIALQDVRADNERLKTELAQLQIRLQQEQEAAAQTRMLQGLLDLKQRTALATVAASVIGGGASPDFRTMTIDIGTRVGLAENMAVVAPAGVVGRVIQAGVLASKVQLLIDRNAAAGVVNERSRAQGIVVGTGTGELHLTYLSGTADVKSGDTLVTSGIDGLYPKGFVVGQIDLVERSAGEFSLVRVRPSVDFSSLESVLVVTTPSDTGQASVATDPLQAPR
ncbi:MAG: rod shape-determining protein MreC [Vicinamibacterales bacterium]